jgi:hypothetical protein
MEKLRNHFNAEQIAEMAKRDAEEVARNMEDEAVKPRDIRTACYREGM